MERIIHLVKEHMFLSWAIASILYALAVHFLFCIEAPLKWMMASWSAGEILTYVSTVSLGLLAVWQNKRFKEENDAAQERLEGLVKQANEISTINKIIEIENDRLNQVKAAMDNFASKCDAPVYTYTLYKDSEKLFKKMSEMNEVENLITQSFFMVLSLLRQNHNLHGDANASLKKTIAEYYKMSVSFTKNILEHPTEDHEQSIRSLMSTKEKYNKQREEYIKSLETHLDQVIYGNMTLEEIKKLYMVGEKKDLCGCDDEHR